jgi:ribonuclease Y
MGYQEMFTLLLFGFGLPPGTDYVSIFTVAFIVASVCSVLATYIGIRFWDSKSQSNSANRASEILRRAEMDAENKIREAEIEIKTKEINIKETNEAEFRTARQELHERERLLDKRQDTLDKQAEEYRKQEKQIENNRRKLAERIVDTNRRNEDLAKLIEKERIVLHEFSGLNRGEATERLLTMLNSELIEETGAIILRHEKQVKERCEAITRNILLASMQRYAASQTADSTVCTVDIPNDEMKGRIIGREGRNIRAFEKATGIDLIIDDTPGVVLLSGFDPIRREVARISLNRLIADGRIHPIRIEEIVEETGKDIQSIIKKAGMEACQEVNIFGLDERIVNLLGRLFYRTSYSQNVLRHSVEVAFLSGMIAVELGLNESLARRCGLLHDVGKAVDHEIEGGHPKIGADFLRRYGEPVEVVQAAAGHHIDLRLDDPYTIIVAAADACSASRPGARRESLENYVKRMEELETVANGFPGVEQTYAVQAGREMRVMLNATIASDENAAKICREIAKTLTEQMQFPGEIKVTVIRETRFVEIAK